MGSAPVLGTRTVGRCVLEPGVGAGSPGSWVTKQSSAQNSSKFSEVEQKDGWLAGGMDGWICGWTDGQRNGRTDGWMEGGTDEKMDS